MSKLTPLFHEHKKLNAKFTEFGGWDMPVQYTSIMDEHNAVRSACGIFDTSHMGTYIISGSGAEEFAKFADTIYFHRGSDIFVNQFLASTLDWKEEGLLIEQVSVLLSDTDLTPNGGPTTASRQTYVSGNAAKHAAMQMREVMSSVAAERLDVSPDSLKFHDGRVGHNGKSASFAEVVEWMQAEGRPTKLIYEYTAPETKPLGQGGDMHVAFSYAAHAALVEVDTDTGEVKVLKVIAAHDIGRAINPLALEGQIEGGIVMGIGNALTEEFPHEKGIPWVQWLARYKMPSIKHTPEIKSFILEHEISSGPFGAKGVGEISSIPITPAITNAIANAVGVRVRRLPVDQDTLLRAMKSGTKSVD